MLGRIAQRIARSAATRGSYCSGTSQTALGQPDSAACAVFSLCRWHSSSHGTPLPWHATTILAVRKGKDVVVIGDGQVSAGPIVVKPNARKVRRVGGGKVIAGFAGTTADAFTLMERLETHLEEYPGQLLRASVEMAKQWRTDRYLRHLEAMLIACDENISLCISGNGDVIEPHDGLLAIGSGGNYALAAARALSEVEGLTALDIAKRAMKVASQMCVYTNENYVIETLEAKTEPPVQASSVGSHSPAPATPLSSETGGDKPTGEKDTTKPSDK